MSNTSETTANVHIDGKFYDVRVREADSENGPAYIVAIDDTYELLTAWRNTAPARRNFAWTGDADSTVPEAVIAFWVNADNELGHEIIKPHWDGEADHNAYLLDDFAGVTGITLAG